MVAEFYLENLSRYPSSESLIPEKIKTFFKSFEETDEFPVRKHSPDHREIVNLLTRESNEGFLNRSGYYFLIDDLLTRGETADNPKDCKKHLVIAAKLLGKSPDDSLFITPSNENLCEEFIVKILDKAELVTQIPYSTPQAFRDSAEELKMRLNDLSDLISKNLTARPNLSEIIEKFVVSWQDFTTLSLKERLISLSA